MRRFFGYVDTTDAGVPFYVGIGTQSRVNQLRRNDKHSHVAKERGIHRTVEYETHDRSAACAWEIVTIYALKTHYLESEDDLGCNFTFGGDGTLIKHTKEARKKISDALRQRVVTSETRAKNGASRRGVKATDETRQRMSVAFTGRHMPPRSAEYCANISARQKGRKASPETRARLSASHKGKIVSTETREKIAAANKHRAYKPLSDEAKAKISAAKRGKPRHCGHCKQPGHVRKTCPNKQA